MSTIKFDFSAIEDLKKVFKEADGQSAKVGWFEGVNYEDGTPVAGIAAQNEYGNPALSIPARSFMRPAIDEHSSEWSNIMAKGAKAASEGSVTMNQVFTVLGEKVSAQIKNKIVSGNHAPLSPITIALRKHRDNGVKITGSFVGAVAGAIARGETGVGQLGDQSHGNKDPLRDSGYMIATLSSEVYKK